jgi:hypothetical protein
LADGSRVAFVASLLGLLQASVYLSDRLLRGDGFRIADVADGSTR